MSLNLVRAKAEKQLLPIEEVLGVNIWNVDYHVSTLVLAGRGRDDTLVTCWFDDESVELEMIAIGSYWGDVCDACTYWVKTGECWLVEPEEHIYQENMARALYCLGLGEPSVLAQLDAGFSEHEKLEVRLSLPREFWPQAWLEN